MEDGHPVFSLCLAGAGAETFRMQEGGSRWLQIPAAPLEWVRLPSCLALDETLSRFTEVINTSYLHKQPYGRV